MRWVLKRAAVLIGCVLIGMQFVPISRSATLLTLKENTASG
jgi:hypothetical protein